VQHSYATERRRCSLESLKRLWKGETPRRPVWPWVELGLEVPPILTKNLCPLRVANENLCDYALAIGGASDIDRESRCITHGASLVVGVHRRLTSRISGALPTSGFRHFISPTSAACGS
jgi:hypothetical protein